MIEDTLVWLLDHQVCNTMQACRYIHNKLTIDECGLMAPRDGDGCAEPYGADPNDRNLLKVCKKRCQKPYYQGVRYRLRKLEKQGRIFSVKCLHTDSNPKRKDLFVFWGRSHYAIQKARLKDMEKRIQYGFIRKFFAMQEERTIQTG